MKESDKPKGFIRYVLLVVSLPTEPDPAQAFDFLNKILPELETQQDGSAKIGTLWVTIPIETIDMKAKAVEAFGSSVVNNNLYVYRTLKMGLPAGGAKCLVVYDKKDEDPKVSSSTKLPLASTNPWWQFWKCKVGIHAWSGCKCSKCGKTRNESHDWVANCEICTKCGKTRSGAHSWSGCKCTKCGNIDDESHDWAADCEMCSKCGESRSGAHSWSGCKCSICGKIRDEGHDWAADCEMCTKCGKSQSGTHSWSNCKCSKCKKTRDEAHAWDGCKCSICGKIRDESHEWHGCKCSKCGKTRNDEHEWEGCKCLNCGRTRDESHSWDGCECSKCGVARHQWESSGLKCRICGEERNLTGKTVVVAGYSLVAPLNKAPERDRLFLCKYRYRSWYRGVWLVDGTAGESGAFVIEKVLD